jgi:hypothetical protein
MSATLLRFDVEESAFLEVSLDLLLGLSDEIRAE